MYAGAQINPDNPENEKSPDSEVWNTRIAGPEFDNISNHRYEPIALERKVPYEFHFVPMGDSPERLKISVVWSGQGVQVFSEMLYFGGNVGRYWNFRILHMGLCWKQKLRGFV